MQFMEISLGDEARQGSNDGNESNTILFEHCSASNAWPMLKNVVTKVESEKVCASLWCPF